MSLVQDICVASETFIEINANRQVVYSNYNTFFILFYFLKFLQISVMSCQIVLQLVVSGKSQRDIKEALRLLNVALYKVKLNPQEIFVQW